MSPTLQIILSFSQRKLSLSKYVGEQKQRSKKCPTIFDTHEDVLQ